MKITVGADPEIFLKDKIKGTFVSAHDLIPGDKKKPFKVKKGAVQVDGTAAEFNIDPASTSKEFCSNLETVLKQLGTMIPKKLEFSYSPTAKYSLLYYRKLPDDCKILGCDPDYNCMTGEVNPTPKPKSCIRHGGGHIHIGWTKDKDVVNDKHHFWDCQQVACVFQDYFGRLQHLWDADKERAKVYGGGSFRPKPYGVEIRSFSNAWLNYPKLWPWIFETSQYLIDRLERGHASPGIYRCTWVNNRDEVSMWNHSILAHGAPAIPVDFNK